MVETPVRGEQGQPSLDTKLGEQGVDRADLHAAPPALVAEPGRLDVIPSIRRHEREHRESSENGVRCPGAAKPLEELLKDQAGREDRLCFPESMREPSDLGCTRRRVSPKREGPNARIDEEIQRRERARL